MYKVLLTTSGTGSRLGELTKHTNKVLVTVGEKPALHYIIERYPKDVPFVVTLGYLGDQVRQALTRDYPDRQFEFVTVDPYEGPMSSLGYSMLQAQPLLQCPFVFHCCDTIVTDEIPVPDRNWVAGYRSDNANHYATLNVKGDEVLSINPKGATSFDYMHIGLVGVRDFTSFWGSLQNFYRMNPEDQTLNDTFVINDLLESGVSFNFIPMQTWFDTGNPTALSRTVAALTK